METITEQKYTFKDFASDQEVRWCPGCDDYVILRSMQKALPDIFIEVPFLLQDMDGFRVDPVDAVCIEVFQKGFARACDGDAANGLSLLQRFNHIADHTFPLDRQEGFVLMVDLIAVFALSSDQ